MRFFGKRLGWGGKLWLAAMVGMFPIMLTGELVGTRWLPFLYVALLVFVGLPILNILDGRNKHRGGKGIIFED